MNVKTLCLGILMFGEATGYDIRKMTQEGQFGHFIDASIGAIYPALTALENDGLVSCREETQSGKPGRKIYTISEAGRRTFTASLMEEPRGDVIKSEFLLVMCCSELVSREHISNVMDNRLADYDKKIGFLQEVREHCTHPGSQFCIGAGLTMYKALRNYYSENRALVEDVAGRAQDFRLASESETQ
ncbi:MAG: PadR family transcriptional regulator [Alphaproteobacteria bacterium]